jgi:uncharacterized protein YdaU (DUF1376 family)
MKKATYSELPLWERFQKAARQRRRSPERLLTDYMRERLEIWEDQRLDEEMRRDAQRGGFHEADAVNIVRQYRREKRAQRAASYSVRDSHTPTIAGAAGR